MPIHERHIDLDDLATIAAVIACSQIVVRETPARRRLPDAQELPDGYDEIDLVILEWIATEARRANRSFVCM
jgi:hypothetical protein